MDRINGWICDLGFRAPRHISEPALWQPTHLLSSIGFENELSAVQVLCVEEQLR